MRLLREGPQKNNSLKILHVSATHCRAKNNYLTIHYFVILTKDLTKLPTRRFIGRDPDEPELCSSVQFESAKHRGGGEVGQTREAEIVVAHLDEEDVGVAVLVDHQNRVHLGDDGVG